MSLYRLGRVPDKQRRFALHTFNAVEQTLILPPQVSYVSLFGSRPDQGGYGCCVSESACELMEAEAIKHFVPTRFSVSANYAQSQLNAYPGHTPVDDGLPTGAGLGTFQTNGYVLDSVRPFPDPKAAPNETYMLAPVPASEWITNFENFTFAAVDPAVDNIRRWLYTRGPIQIGLQWANSWFAPETNGTLPVPDYVAGGHALVIAAYDDRSSCFTIANSWGTSWGSQPFSAQSRGWCYLPYSYVTEYPDYWPQDLYGVSVIS
jgi:hypothetical protein